MKKGPSILKIFGLILIMFSIPMIVFLVAVFYATKSFTAEPTFWVITIGTLFAGLLLIIADSAKERLANLKFVKAKAYLDHDEIIMEPFRDEEEWDENEIIITEIDKFGNTTITTKDSQGNILSTKEGRKYNLTYKCENADGVTIDFIAEEIFIPNHGSIPDIVEVFYNQQDTSQFKFKLIITENLYYEISDEYFRVVESETHQKLLDDRKSLILTLHDE